MKTRTFFSLLLLLVAAVSCKKEERVFPSDSQTPSSTSKMASPSVDQLKIDIGYNLIPSGVYFIQPMAHPELDLALDAPTDGVIIQQDSRNCTNWNQMWYVTYLGNGYYSITGYLHSQSYGKSFDVRNGSLAPGVKIQHYTYRGTLNQQWRIGTSISTGLSTIYGRQSGLALDVPYGYGTPGVQIQQFTPNNGSNQTWKFTRACQAYGETCCF